MLPLVMYILQNSIEHVVCHILSHNSCSDIYISFKQSYAHFFNMYIDMRPSFNCGFDPSPRSQHVDVSLGKILNPELLPMASSV